MISAYRPSKLTFVSPALVPARTPRNFQVRNRAVFSSVDGPRWNYNLHYDASTRLELGNGVSKKRKSAKERKEDGSEEEEGEGEGEGEGDRKVQCEVEVVSWRERRVKAVTFVQADVDSVWNALTDYERLADFVPNLVSSKRIRCPYPGRIWLEQRGFQRALYWHIEARVVLDLQEFINSEFDRELHFSMVEGDFKKFEGKWSVKCGTRSSTSILSYEVSVIPRLNFPAIFLERIIRSDLPVNLRALAYRAERILEGNQNVVTTEKYSSSKTYITGNRTDTLPHRGFKEDFPISNSGLLTPCETEPNFKEGLLKKSCSPDRQCMVDEVHLRRFDGLLENGGVHRFVVASITVKAPVREVWNVLTAYERLPEIVPHLAISKILSRENNKVRILQEGCKGLLYMVLHARVVLDLCELYEQEISFEQVEGDFDSLKGKWILEQLGNHHTLLKYTVESKMHKDTFLSEAIMEEVIYEDLPSNLSAIRDYVEKRVMDQSSEAYEQSQKICTEDCTSSSDSDDEDEDDDDVDLVADEVSDSTSESTSRHRQRVPGLQRNIEILKEELLKFISEHGKDGLMPMRKQLRKHGRVDIEKAIARMGGFRRIASLMNLSLAYKNRKPKGFWDSLENLRDEIHGFQRNWGIDPSLMPSRRTFERAGRYDIARALEKWGGLHEVSRLLSLKASRASRHMSISPESKTHTPHNCLSKLNNFSH